MKNRLISLGILISMSISLVACGIPVKSVESQDTSVEQIYENHNNVVSEASEILSGAENLNDRLGKGWYEEEMTYEHPIRIPGNLDQEHIMLDGKTLLIPESSVLIMSQERWGDKLRRIDEESAGTTSIFQLMETLELEEVAAGQLNMNDYQEMDSDVVAYFIHSNGSYFHIQLYGYKDNRIHLIVQEALDAPAHEYRGVSEVFHRELKRLIGVEDTSLEELKNATDILYHSSKGVIALSEEEREVFRQIISERLTLTGNYQGGSAFDLHIEFGGKKADIATDSSGYIVVGDTTYKVQNPQDLKKIFKDAQWDGNMPE